MRTVSSVSKTYPFHTEQLKSISGISKFLKLYFLLAKIYSHVLHGIYLDKYLNQHWHYVHFYGKLLETNMLTQASINSQTFFYISFIQQTHSE